MPHDRDRYVLLERCRVALEAQMVREVAGWKPGCDHPSLEPLVEVHGTVVRALDDVVRRVEQGEGEARRAALRLLPGGVDTG